MRLLRQKFGLDLACWRLPGEGFTLWWTPLGCSLPPRNFRSLESWILPRVRPLLRLTLDFRDIDRVPLSARTAWTAWAIQRRNTAQDRSATSKTRRQLPAWRCQAEHRLTRRRMRLMVPSHGRLNASRVLLRSAPTALWIVFEVFRLRQGLEEIHWIGPLLICVKDRSAGMALPCQNWDFGLCSKAWIVIGQGSRPGPGWVWARAARRMAGR